MNITNYLIEIHDQNFVDSLVNNMRRNQSSVNPMSCDNTGLLVDFDYKSNRAVVATCSCNLGQELKSKVLKNQVNSMKRGWRLGL